MVSRVRVSITSQKESKVDSSAVSSAAIWSVVSFSSESLSSASAITFCWFAAIRSAVLSDGVRSSVAVGSAVSACISCASCASVSGAMVGVGEGVGVMTMDAARYSSRSSIMEVSSPST